MLDVDDNEDHFSRSQNARDQAYGQAALNLSARLTEAISARTAASITLCEEFGALMLRHVRAPSPADQTAAVAPSSTLSVGFVGTVRRHKRLVEAAGAVQAFSALTGIPAQLHVRGDIRPEAMVRDLEQAGAVVGGEVPMAALPAHLRSFDVVLSGYPGTEGDHEITRYQISSKIGDALAAGKSVMVPNSPSVRDLDEVPGVFLFTPETFGETLMQALSFAGEIALPVPFTVEGAQETLDAA
jgi:hypothetical protein